MTPDATHLKVRKSMASQILFLVPTDSRVGDCPCPILVFTESRTLGRG